MVLRAAEPADFEAITAIYNDLVVNSTAVYNDQPASVDERHAWSQSRCDAGYPVLVAVQGATVIGYGSCSQFRSWPGYRFTVECTLHIHRDWRSRGAGAALLAALKKWALETGKHAMVAVIDSENEGSLRFFQNHGFQMAGRLPEVGHKFERFLDICLLHYRV